MRVLQSLSIRNKLIIIIVLVSSLAIVVGFTIVIINDINTFKDDMTNNTIVNAKLIGEYCVTPLAFQDETGAEEIMTKLQAIPSITNGCVYDDNGDLFAVFNKAEKMSIPPLPEKESSIVFEENYLHIFHPIIYQNQKYGTIYLRASTALLADKTKKYLITMISLMIVLMVLSYLLACRLQKFISEPILKLAHVTEKISKEADYSLRVQKPGTDEIGILYDSFNSMLEQVHIREMERDRAEETLLKARDELGVKVAERTEELTQANERLKELDQLKSMFIASMSHELRTPLNSIIGFTGIILQGIAGETTEEQRKQLTMVKNSANHLLALINDIIDVSKIEAGKVELVVEEFDLSTLVQEVKDLFTVATNEKDLNLLLEMPENLVVESDERRVKQIIVNLVSNAVKFTEKGEIEIRAAKKDERVEILVRDTGIGMKKEDIDKLFKAFSRIPTEDRLTDGTGLGLYLSKKMTDLLGGEIRAESEFGKGSKFRFTLPLKYKEVKT